MGAKLCPRCRKGTACLAQDADSLDPKTGQKKEGLFYLWTGAAGCTRQVQCWFSTGFLQSLAAIPQRLHHILTEFDM